MAAVFIDKSFDYEEHQSLEVGTVLKLDEPNLFVEEVHRKFSAKGVTITPIVPGSTLYTIYKESHAVIVINTNV